MRPLVLMLALLFGCVPCVAVDAQVSNSTAAANASPTVEHARSTNFVAEGMVPARLTTEAEKENMELRLEAKLKEHVSTQFAFLMSTALALFATLITVVVIFFALRPKDAAVAEARHGVEEFRTSAEGMDKTIRREFEVAKNELETILVKAAASAQAINDMRFEAESWASNVAQRVAAGQSLSTTDQLTLDLRSTNAARKNAAAFSDEDYLLLIAKHIENGDWGLVRELAASMRLVTSSPDLQSAGYFYEGTALFKLKRISDAIQVLTEAIEKFRESDRAEVRHQVAKAMINRLVTLMGEGRHEDVLKLVPEGLAYLASSVDPRAEDMRLKFLINKGNALSRLGRNPEALACYDDVIANLAGNDTPQGADRRARALNNKACAFAQMGKVNDCVAHLEESRVIAITVATKDIATDPDFDPVRRKPTFKRFLKKQSIAAATAPASIEPSVSASGAGQVEAAST